ncbi:hypothetical protein DRQ32_02330 [bacterium]|nr:MAG: hypothetical protein DRQ32_02330 [bacterium]
MRLSGICLLLALLTGCSAKPMWPTTSNNPAPVLAHPDFAATLEREDIGRSSGFRIAIMGDQRALADGEFQALAREIARREDTLAGVPPLVAIIDSGDIVENGKYADQFAMLAEILTPLRHWPWLVAAGNHELDNSIDPQARTNFVQFMGEVPGPFFAPRRLWYRKNIPGARILFLDSNDWVYGPSDDQSVHNTDQLAWLSAQMAEDFDGRTIVVMHHPILSSSKKHRGMALRMWKIQWSDDLLAEMFLNGGVDLVVVGHTHSYERYRLTDPEGRSLQLVNISGRPRPGFLWFGAGPRRAKDIRGQEMEYFARLGWPPEQLAGWTIEQLEAMSDEDTEANQWGELTVGPEGRFDLEMFYLVDHGEGGIRSGGVTAID